MTTTKYTISAARRATGLSRTTIANHIKDGKLSCETNDQGHKLIDGSELHRVYGDKFDPGRGKGGRAAQQATGDCSAISSDDQNLHSELNTVQQQLATEREERRREREQLQGQIDNLQ